MKLSTSVKLASFLMLIVFLISSCHKHNVNPSDTCCDGVIKVLAKDSVGKPINDVQISLFKDTSQINSYTTGNDGIAIFKGICTGTYRVYLKRTGYQDINYCLAEHCNDTLSFDKTMLSPYHENDSCCNSMVKISVVDSKGNMLPGIILDLYKDNTKIAEFKTGDYGVYLLTNMCKGNYKVLLSGTNYKSLDFTFSLHCNEDLSFIETLIGADTQDSCCNGVANIVALDSKGNKLPNIAIYLYKNGTQIGCYYTGHDGYYSISKLCHAQYSISLSGTGYTSQDFTFIIKCNDTLNFTKTMIATHNQDSCCYGVIKGKVVDDKNTTVPSATIKLAQNGAILTHVLSDAHGYFIFTNICHGSYSLYLLKTGYTTTSYEVSMGCNDTIEVTEILPQTHSDTCCTAVLKIQAVDDSTGLPMNDVKVEICNNNNLIYSGYTGNDGWLSKEQLCAPLTYSVKLTFNGYNTSSITYQFAECNTESMIIRMKRP